jgi:uncharacterized protein
MKTWSRAVLFFLLIFSIESVSAQINFPEPSGVVNDFAEVLSDASEEKLNTLISEIKEKTSAEVAVVTVNSLEGTDPNYYAVELGRTWGVGNKERDDGVVFLTAIEDRKTYIASGYGVEGEITDAQAFWITDKVVVPFFKVGDYEGGILAGTQKIHDALLNLERLPEGDTSPENWDPGVMIFFVFFIFSFVIPWLIAIFGRSKSWWPGGVAGGVLGVILAAIFGVTFFIILPLAIFGFIFDFLASKNYKQGVNRWWTGGGGGGWGGGGSFGGGSSGSFGGFSGGSFGGGGSGSSW